MKMLVIPTHRLIQAAVESILQEYMSIESRNNNYCLLVPDNSKRETYASNHRYLLNQASRQIDIYHVGLDHMAVIVKKLADLTGVAFDELKILLYPDRIDYGKISNMIYILAMILDAESIHRRDSDCNVFSLTREQYPLRQEVKYLNSPPAKVFAPEELDIETVQNDLPEELIRIVGSDYIGDWDLDLKEIQALNPQALPSLMSICGVSDHLISTDMEEKYLDQSVKNDKAILNTVFSNGTTPENGNISFSEVYKIIPNFIGTNGIGFDNHTYFMAFSVKVPIVFHQSKIHHRHDAARMDDISLLRYWRGMAKMIDYDYYHYAFLQMGWDKELCKADRGLPALADNQDIIPQMFEETLAEIPREQRVKRIERIVKEILIPTKHKLYIQVGDYLMDNRESIIDELDLDYARSLRLHRLWKKISSAAHLIDRSILHDCLCTS